MESNYQLIRSNAALETELRLVKEQLSQAQNANQFLVGQMSAFHCGPREFSRNLDEHEQQMKLAVEENSQLKNRINLVEQHNNRLRYRLLIADAVSHRARGKYQKRCRRTLQHGNYQLRTKTSMEASSTAKHSCRHEDLLSFANDKEDVLYTKPIAYSPSNKEHGNKAVDNGCFNPESVIPNSAHSIKQWISPEQQVAESAPQTALPKSLGFSIFQGDKPIFVPTCTAEIAAKVSSETQAQPPQAKHQEATPFTDGEHNRLLGAACFIEAETHERQVEHWLEYEQSHPQHSAAEWRSYYGSVIRPLYQQKCSNKPLIDLGPDFGGLSISESDAPDQQDILKPENLSKGGSDSIETAISDQDAYTKLSIQSKRPGEATEDQSSPTINVRSAATQITTGKIIGPGLYTVKPGSIAGQRCSGAVLPQVNRISKFHPHQPCHFPPEDVQDICFKPQDDEKINLRTVLISNLPTNLCQVDILSKVRGDRIVSSTLHETAGMKTNPPIDMNSMTLVFLSALGAERFAKQCTEKNPLLLPSDTGGGELVPAHVARVLTPTRLIRPSLFREIQESGMTRVLGLRDPRQQSSPHLAVDGFVDYLVRTHGIVDPLMAGMDDDGTISLEFSGVAEARAALAVLEKNAETFGAVEKWFLPDPCDRPLETELDSKQLKNGSFGNENAC